MPANAPFITIFSGTTAAGTAAGTLSPESGVPMPSGGGGCVFMLNLTAAATDVGDTLDVYVQMLVGSAWVDVVHFTQILGNGGAKRFFAKIGGDLAEAMFENGSALAAGSVRNIIGDKVRIKYDITDANSNSAFTFSVVAKRV